MFITYWVDLAPDSDLPMPLDTQKYVQDNWLKIQKNMSLVQNLIMIFGLSMSPSAQHISLVELLLLQKNSTLILKL